MELAMKHILQPGEGETLKLGPPFPGEVILKVDPQQVATPFVSGTETLQRGAEIPVLRHRDRDEVWCVLKGQGRATVEDQTVTVVPGAMVYAPKQTWHGLQNTGTGMLQILWVSAPPGLEAYYRDLSRLDPSADPSALQELAERHGVEFRPGGAPTSSKPEGRMRRRRHRGGHGRRRAGGRSGPATEGKPQEPQPAAAAKPASSSEEDRTPASQPPVARSPGPPSRLSQAPGRAPVKTAGAGGDGQGRARGRRRPDARRSGPPQQKATAPQPASNRSRESGRGRRRSRVKEVYMGGKWVRVEGDGPVISP